MELALRDGPFELISGGTQGDWSGLPPELLELIGAKLADGVQLSSAAMVCKNWNSNIVAGLTSLEMDMHSDPAMWRAKVARLQSLIRHLSTCVVHVNTTISTEMLFQNLALIQQLRGVSDLQLHLREGCELPPPAAAAIGAMTQLTSLSIVGGGLSREAAEKLLSALAANAAAAAAAAPRCSGRPAVAAAAGSNGGGGCLSSLRLLPSVRNGLGDDEMPLLAGCSGLEVLEFRAYRLTSSGLAVLSSGLPRLARLAISSLDCDSGYELACLERLAALAELDLALDAAPTAAAGRASLCAVRPGRSLSLSFRWTERAQGLLSDAASRLANLRHLDVGTCRVGSETVFEAVAALTGLVELRMAVYSNADHAIPCHLSRLSALGALQKFHLEKRAAYFPEARRFGESSIAVPVTPAGLRALAGRWSRLRALRLALSRSDYSPEALAALSAFTGLQQLGIVAERYPGHASAGSSNAGGSSSSSGASTSPPGPGLACGALGRHARRGAEPPPAVSLACLPAGLTALELNGLAVELGAAGEAWAGGEPGGAGAGTDVGAGRAEGVAKGAGGGSPAHGGGAVGPGQQVPFAPNGEGNAACQPSTQAQPTSPGPSSAGAGAGPAPLLPRLARLDVEACVLRPALLASLPARVCPGLTSLRLAGCPGLTDAALTACLGGGRLPGLRSLTISAPGNRAVSQASLAALSAARPPLPPLRHLSWESEDLTARGPALAALAPLTLLRHLWLSCTERTAERALGALSTLTAALPYCHVDMVWSSGSRPEGV